MTHVSVWQLIQIAARSRTGCATSAHRSVKPSRVCHSRALSESLVPWHLRSEPWIPACARMTVGFREASSPGLTSLAAASSSLFRCFYLVFIAVAVQVELLEHRRLPLIRRVAAGIHFPRNRGEHPLSLGVQGGPRCYPAGPGTAFPNAARGTFPPARQGTHLSATRQGMPYPTWHQGGAGTLAGPRDRCERPMGARCGSGTTSGSVTSQRESSGMRRPPPKRAPRYLPRGWSGLPLGQPSNSI